MSIEWTKAKSKLQLWFHKLFLLTLQLLLHLSQAVSLAPVTYDSRQTCRFRTHPLLTTAACVKCVSLTLAARVLYRLSTALYGATNVRHRTLFTQIANMTMASDIAVSLLLSAMQIVERKRLTVFLNALQRLLQLLMRHTSPRLVNWRLLALLAVKLLLSGYELLFNVPFFVRVSRQLGVMRLLAYVAHLYVQHLSSIYANAVFGIMLLLLACLQQLQADVCRREYLPQRKLFHLLKLERHLCDVVATFMQCFQFGILLTIFNSFLNILANMYAMLDYFVSAHGVPLTMSNYVLIVTAELYAIILGAQLCMRSHQRIRDRLEALIYAPAESMDEYSHLQKQIYSLDWPLKPLDFPVLGMFALDHDFWIFLVAYAANFIVIILQFTLENIK